MSSRLVAALLPVLLLAGCGGYQKPRPAFHQVLTEPYRLDSGDKLRVTVFGQTELTGVYGVDQSGHVALPLIGAVPARGQTTAEIETVVAARLRGGFLKTPDVSVEVDQYRPFFVMGEVKSAGQYTFVPGMTVQNAVAIAGGFTARAFQSDADITRQINGEVMSGRVPLTDPVRPGDTIHVRERWF